MPPPPGPVLPVSVLYCAVCTYPPEYCDFGASLTNCKDWLKGEHPDLFDKYYSDGDSSHSFELEKDMAKKEIKAEVKADVALKKKMASQIIIKQIEQNKHKHITIDLKKVSKQFSSKFAMGSSVTKNLQGLEEIIVSGDVSSEILEMIDNEAGVLKGIPADNVELVEKKKKGGD
ncbi:hypothetical protein B0H10DRAFT_2164937 [Mycena sp. CBHHK59/15]|nr:hypothetical protein B0H10DRAFT_2164937 [Mycena sp. CBHHK59/15]